MVVVILSTFDNQLDNQHDNQHAIPCKYGAPYSEGLPAHSLLSYLVQWFAQRLSSAPARVMGGSSQVFVSSLS